MRYTIIFLYMINVTFKAKDNPDFNALHFAQAHNIYDTGKKKKPLFFIAYVLKHSKQTSEIN